MSNNEPDFSCTFTAENGKIVLEYDVDDGVNIALLLVAARDAFFSYIKDNIDPTARKLNFDKDIWLAFYQHSDILDDLLETEEGQNAAELLLEIFKNHVFKKCSDETDITIEQNKKLLN